MANALPYIVSFVVAVFIAAIVLRFLAPWVQRVVISMMTSGSAGLALAQLPGLAMACLSGLVQALVCVVVFRAFGHPPATLMLWILGLYAWLPPFPPYSLPAVGGLLAGWYLWYPA